MFCRKCKLYILCSGLSLLFGLANLFKMWFWHLVHITFVIAQVRYQYWGNHSLAQNNKMNKVKLAIWYKYGLHFPSFSKPYFPLILPTQLWINISLLICSQMLSFLLFCLIPDIRIYSCHLNTRGYFIPFPSKWLDPVSKNRAKNPRELKVFRGLGCRNDTGIRKS